MFWSVHVMVILKAKRVRLVVCRNDAASLVSHEAVMDTMEAGDGNVTDKKLAKDVECSRTIQGAVESPISCVLSHQYDPRKM